MNLNKLLNSILINGCKSADLSDFIAYCSKIAISCFNKSKFRKNIICYMQHSIEDIAVDLIGDLFKVQNGKFIYFNEYFMNQDIENCEEVVIESKLFALIYTNTNQRITKIRIENGEFYFKVEKSLDMEIKRHPELYKLLKNKKVLIYTCEKNELRMQKPFFTEKELLCYLLRQKYKTAELPEIMFYIFECLNNQNDFCKTLERKFIATLITNFYKQRQNCGIFNE